MIHKYHNVVNQLTKQGIIYFRKNIKKIIKHFLLKLYKLKVP